ncbi:MAG: hypothetical protein JRJ84_17895 [Deltaproteobacteria bacterium]|nr:hypothetical protein [Deltaproteobacteria bacterium]
MTAAAEGATLFLRGFGEEDRGAVDAQLTLLGPTMQLQGDLLRRIGLPYWALLDRGEQNALTRTVWRSLRVGSGSDEEVHARWIMRSDLRLTPEEQALAGTTIPPGRAVALNLVGPVSVRVSGGSEVLDLEHEVVSAEPGEVRATPDDPVAVGTDVAAIRYHLPPGPTSLHLRNHTERPIGPFLFAVDHARPDQLFGKTAGARLEDLAPAGTGLQSEVVLVGPEWNNLTGYRVGGENEAPLVYSGYWPAGGDVIQMLVRPVLDGADDRAPRVVDVHALDDTGAELWRDSAAFTPVAAPYERLLESDAWLGEPEELYVAVNAAVRQLSVRSANDVVVMMRVRGAPQGDPELYPLPEGEVRVRYPRRPVTTWRTVDPVNGPTLVEQLVRVSANTRLEPRGTRDVESGRTRYYSSIRPADARHAQQGRVWLRPADPTDPEERLVYCRYTPGGEAPFPRNAEVVKRLDGLLAGALWTPGSASLGSPYRILLDQSPWQSGRLTQRVHRFRKGREPPRSRVSLEGPPGSTLWLRTWTRPGACPAPHLSIMAWPLDPGEEIQYAVTRTMEKERFMVGGFGEAGTRLRVRIEDGTPGMVAGLHRGWSDKDQTLELTPLPDVLATPVDDPEGTLPALQSRGTVLATNLHGSQYRIRVQNVSDHRMYLRAAVQTPQPGSEPWGTEVPSLVRVQEVTP